MVKTDWLGGVLAFDELYARLTSHFIGGEKLLCWNQMDYEVPLDSLQWLKDAKAAAINHIVTRCQLKPTDFEIVTVTNQIDS